MLISLIYVINDQGFEDFDPIVCFPQRRDIRVLSDAPKNEPLETVAVGWAASVVIPEEEYLVAFKHSDTEFKVVHYLSGNKEHQVYVVEA